MSGSAEQPKEETKPNVTFAQLLDFYEEQRQAVETHRANLSGALEEEPERSATPAAYFDLGRLSEAQKSLDALAAFVLACSADANGGLTVERIAAPQEPGNQT